MRPVWQLVTILVGAAVLGLILANSDAAVKLAQTGANALESTLVVVQGRSPRTVL